MESLCFKHKLQKMLDDYVKNVELDFVSFKGNDIIYALESNLNA